MTLLDFFVVVIVAAFVWMWSRLAVLTARVNDLEGMD